MADIQMKSLDGAMKSLPESAVDEFAAGLRGALIKPSDANYDDVRVIWNAMIDRKPGLIVQCAGAADVSRAVNFAKANGLLMTVRGAGHNIAGNSISDGGLLIDLSCMKSVRVNKTNSTVRVEPGVTLGELDSETQAYGMAVPTGINSTTGIAGLTLGGGFGWLSRKSGLTADNLISADIVTADGELRLANAKENSDLFWAMRGGGGNFGIVTSFEFSMQAVGPEILSGLIVHPIKDAPATLRFYREFCAQAPDELTVWVVLRKAPPLPFLSEDVHGTDVMILAAMYNGDMAEGEKALKPLRDFGNPHADVISPHPFTGWQAAFDPLLTPGVRNYWKSHDFKELNDDALDTIVNSISTLPSGQTEVFIAQMGGATNRVAADATAYYHRDVEFILNVHGRWENAGDDDKCISWCRGLFDSMTPFSTGGVYINFMTEEEGGRVKAAYGGVYDKLVALKKKYDPNNLFRYNQNIKPG
jgi:FAD/FMN-containing dehydrogenase